MIRRAAERKRWRLDALRRFSTDEAALEDVHAHTLKESRLALFTTLDALTTLDAPVVVGIVVRSSR